MSSNRKPVKSCPIDREVFPMPQEVWERVSSRLGLSPHHKLIVERVLHGRQRKQIVQDLDSTDSSIGTHFKRIYQYHGIAGRDALILLIFRLAVQELAVTEQ